MQLGPFLLLTFAFGLMLLLIQRTERKRRVIALGAMILFGIIVVRYINYRGYQMEGFWGFVAALALNFLFWLFIGRYHPVKSSDEMKVLGMDD